MPKLKQCKQCGGFWTVNHGGTTRFCSRDCYDTWWSEARSKHEVRSQVAEKIHGAVPSVELTDIQAAWIAGLIDGEGCLGIWRERRQGNKSGFRYRAVVQIANTNRALLDAVAAVLPGTIQLKDARRTSALRHKPLYQFCVFSRCVGPVLKAVAPYLVIKKTQAEALMRFRDITDNAPVRASQDHELLEPLYQQCRALNRRGLAPITGD